MTDLDREVTAAEIDRLTLLFRAFVVACVERGFRPEAIALASLACGADLMTEVKNSPMFTIRCLERVASGQVERHNSTLAAEIDAIKTEGNA